MLIITKVEVLEHDDQNRGYAEIIKEPEIPCIQNIKDYIGSKNPRDIVSKIETIYPQKFVVGGKEYQIGVSKDAGKLINEIFDAIDDTHRILQSMRTNIKVLEDSRDYCLKKFDNVNKELYTIKHYGFFKRLKCLFTGIK